MDGENEIVPLENQKNRYRWNLKQDQKYSLGIVVAEWGPIWPNKVREAIGYFFGNHEGKNVFYELYDGKVIRYTANIPALVTWYDEGNSAAVETTSAIEVTEPYRKNYVTKTIKTLEKRLD